MIKAEIATQGSGLERRLTAMARRIALARLAIRKPSLRATGAHWRDARLLWPQFTKEQ